MSKNDELKQYIDYQIDATELAVVAYKAKDATEILNNSKVEAEKAAKEGRDFNQEHYVREKLKISLMNTGDHAFSAAQAEAFVQRYQMKAALDEEGAGAIIVTERSTGQNKVGVRGTDIPANTYADSIADITITFGHLPSSQATRIDNFIVRETAPKGMPVSQLDADSIMLKRTSDATGTGNAEGNISLIAGHSKGGPLTSAIGALHKAPVVTINAPGVPHEAIQPFVDASRKLTGRSANPLDQNQLHIDTTGVSIISQLHGGLSGDRTLVPTANGSHSSAVALITLREVKQLVIDNPKIQEMAEVVQLSRLNELDRQATLDIYNNNRGATMENSIELVALSKGRESVTMAGYGHGEAAYQDALRQMQEANNKAIAEAAKYDTASQHGQQLNQLRQQANTDYNNAPFDYKETRGGDPEGKKAAEQTYREYKDNRYHGANEYTKDHKAIEKDQQYHHYTPPKPYNQSENEKLQGKSWSDASDYIPAAAAVAIAATNSTDPKFQATYDKILTEIRDDPDVMGYLAKNGMDTPQGLSSIAAHAANQSYANGAHPVLGVVMMDDGQLTVAYQNSGKIYSDDYTIDMAQAIHIDPKISEQTATLALEQHHQDFAAYIAQYQIPGGMTHGMGLVMPGSNSGDGGSV